MNLQRRGEVLDILRDYMKSCFGSFTAHFGYSAKYNAADFSRVLAVRLESPSPNAPQESLYGRFVAANSILKQFLKMGGRATPKLQTAVDVYKSTLREVVQMVFFSISQGHVIHAPRYFLVYVHKVRCLLFRR
jgi:hypothetical protein